LAGAVLLGTALLALGVAPVASAGVLGGPRGVVPARSLASRVLGVPVRAGVRLRGVVRPQAKVTLPKLNYHEGPVMHTNRVYTIFWQPSPLPAGVTAFKTTPSYEEVVNNYFKRVAADSHKASNAYSVATQYAGGAGIEYATTFGESVPDTDPYPSSSIGSPPASCKDKESEEPSAPVLKVCLTGKQIEEEIEKVIAAHHWPTGLGDLYFVYTPRGVGSCFAAGEEWSKAEDACAYAGKGGYCAYHSNKGEEVIWANLPYEQTETCNDTAEPEGSDAGPAIDTSSHEHNEAISDPTEGGWWDGDKAEIEEARHGEPANTDFGEEIADLCVLPSFAETYGPLLGGSGGGIFNQVIAGHDYLLQQEWNEATTATGGGCSQLLLQIMFTPPTGVHAGQPARFDASGSANPEDPAQPVTFTWNFGDGSPAGSGEAPTHIYAAAGEYTVTLTAADANGNSNTTTRKVTVGSEEVTTTTTTSTTDTASSSTTATTTISTVSTPPVVTATSTSTTATPIARLSDAALADALGLPNGAAILTGADTFTLGHAVCPAACTVTAAAYTTVHATRHGHRLSRRKLVGTAHASGAGALIALKLNAIGRALLRRNHPLTVQLVITTEGSQGAHSIIRTLTLTAGRTVRHARRG
jgi:hypothetical protein